MSGAVFSRLNETTLDKTLGVWNERDWVRSFLEGFRVQDLLPNRGREDLQEFALGHPAIAPHRSKIDKLLGQVQEFNPHAELRVFRTPVGEAPVPVICFPQGRALIPSIPEERIMIDNDWQQRKGSAVLFEPMRKKPKLDSQTASGDPVERYPLQAPLLLAFVPDQDQQGIRLQPVLSDAAFREAQAHLLAVVDEQYRHNQLPENHSYLLERVLVPAVRELVSRHANLNNDADADISPMQWPKIITNANKALYVDELPFGPNPLRIDWNNTDAVFSLPVLISYRNLAQVQVCFKRDPAPDSETGFLASVRILDA